MEPSAARELVTATTGHEEAIKEDIDGVDGLADFLEKARLPKCFKKLEALLVEWGAVEIQEMLNDPELLETAKEHLELKVLEKRRFDAAAAEVLKSMKASTGDSAKRGAALPEANNSQAMGARDSEAAKFGSRKGDSELDGARPAEPRRGGANPDGDDLRMVVKNTFIEMEPTEGPMKVTLPRTVTAPPRMVKEEAIEDAEANRLQDTVEEEDEEEDDDVVPEVGTSPQMPKLSRERTMDPFDQVGTSPPLSKLPRERTIDPFDQAMDPSQHVPMPMMHPMMWPMMPPAAYAWGPGGMGYGMHPDMGYVSYMGAGMPVRPMPMLGQTGGDGALPPKPLLQMFPGEDGHVRVHWNVTTQKLASKDTHPHMSPTFKLSFGSSAPSVDFKMMIHPKVTSDSKGGASFKKAKGKGYIELVCEGSAPGMLTEVSFCISIGSDACLQQARGPVLHNFVDKKVGSLPKDQAEWDFNTAVSQGFVLVNLDIAPCQVANDGSL